MKKPSFASPSVFILTFCVLVLLCTVFSAFLPLSGEEGLRDMVIRLHVLANSDSDEDQSMKLKVRDAVLECIGDRLEGCDTKEEAAERLASVIPEISRAAEEELRLNKDFHSVSVTLGEEYYPEKEYGKIKMPSGKYLSLKVGIGEAEGHNWWCVAFPPLCLSAAESEESNEEALIRAGFTGEQYRIITNSEKPRYKLKFKLIELFSQWFWS